MEASPKVRHFFWHLCTETLPVRILLKVRHMVENSRCPWCNTEEETVGHAIFYCISVNELWEECGCLPMKEWREARSMCNLVESWEKVEAKMRQRGCFLAWCIWGERNQKVLEDKFTPNAIIIERVNRLVEEHDKYTARIYNAARPKVGRSPKCWKAPPVGIIKLNVDASLTHEGWIGLGVVAQDHEGRVIFAATRRTRAHWPPKIAEEKSLAMEIRLGRRYRIQNAILESDSQVLINRLSKGAIYFSDLDSVLGDILSIMFVLILLFGLMYEERAIM
ncbi:uncharacterized protein [Spinacia oleracea]|uniref:Reverse transcriptase zinc-binding domain-containing protein n=1 Tax=Spinacia oleracea TaxID=3562 RepID=A0ABM3RQ25_SPIOL|nr:uncharacterized protein LOC130471545 [Spinacia oleracea]